MEVLLSKLLKISISPSDYPTTQRGRFKKLGCRRPRLTTRNTAKLCTKLFCAVQLEVLVSNFFGDYIYVENPVESSIPSGEH